jgi:type IV secretion system protein VirD4
MLTSDQSQNAALAGLAAIAAGAIIRAKLLAAGLDPKTATIAALLLAGLIASVGWCLWARFGSTHLDRGRAERHRKGLATARQLAEAFPPVEHGLALGTPIGGGRALVVAPNRSVGLLMAPQSGKSSAAIPWILDAPWCCVASSSKPELLFTTAELRTASTGSTTLVFDPLDICGWPELVRWSPVAGCEEPAVAMRRAAALVAGMSTVGMSDGGFFKDAASILLRVCLHAAALSGGGVGQVRSWVGDPYDVALQRLIVRSPFASEWMADLKALTLSHGKTVQSIALTTNNALDCLALPDVVRMCSPAKGEGFDPADWLRTGGTVHVVAPDAEAASVAPLTAAFVDELVLAARAMAARSAAGRLIPPLRLVLDEVPQICPLPHLVNYVADGGGRGIQIVWMAQTMDGLSRVFGRDGAGAIVAATSVMCYGATQDLSLARDICGMLGQVEMRTTTRSHQTDRAGVGSAEHIQRLDTVEPADILRLRTGEALMLAGGVGGAFIRLPWWKKRRDARAIEAALAAADKIRTVPVDR